MALNNLTRVTGSGFGTETSINTTGIITAASFSGDGSSLTGVVGSGSGLIIQEEGSNVGTAGTINFVGTGVTATMSGAVATIEITSSGGGGGGGISSIFEDTTPRLSGDLDANSKNITGISSIDSGSGELFVKSDIIRFKKHDDTESIAVFNSDGPVNLFFNGSKKFETTNTGAEISGDLTATSLSVGTALDITSNNSSSTIQANNSSSPFYIQALNNNFISILAGTGSQGRVTLYNQGKVEIAHAGSVKFKTTSTGAEITGNLTATSFSGDVTGTATIATNVTVADESSDTSCFLLYSTEATGNIAPKTGSNLTFNSSSGTLSAATFVGDGSGLTGITASGSGVIVRDGGSLVGTAGTIDFGTNVSVSPISAGVVTVTAAAGTIAGINTSGTTELNNLIVSGIATFSNNIDANGNLNLAGDFQLSGGISAAGSSDNLNWGSGNFYFNSGSPELGWSNSGEVVVNVGSSGYGHSFSIQGRNARDNMAVFTTGGGADLYYNNVKKFETTSTGAVVTGILTATTFSGSGDSLTTLNASELDSGTIPDARFPATLPAASGANLTNLPAANITGTLPAISGANLTNLPAAGISTAFSNVQVTWNVTSNGASAYRFTGPGNDASDDNPDLYLIRGQRYRFTNNSGGSHPFQIRSSPGGSAYSTGVTNNGGASGNIDFNVQHDAPERLYYQCTSHSGMVGNIIILGDIISEGSWTASAGTAQTIDTITGAVNNGIKTAEYTVHIENGSNMQAQKVLVMQDGTTAYSQEYAIMHKSGLLVSISATISGGNLLLQATPETGVSGTTTYKVTHQVV